MARQISSFLNRRSLAAASLLAASAYVALAHQPQDEGIAAQEVTPQLVAQELAALPDASRWSTGNWLLDFVEPADGEGGSEEAIAQMVAELNAMPGVHVEKAGFYSEGEHLFRLSADPQTWDTIDDDLIGHELLEGVEPELLYRLPTDAISAVASPTPQSGDDAEIHKPPRMQPDDPMYPLQWHMDQIHSPEAWVTAKGKGATVAIIDTGVAWKTAHGVKQLPDLAGTDFRDGESFVAGVPDGLDDHAHGSHVAGTVAQTTNNGIGVAGVAHEATIMPLKVLSKEGRGSVPGIANAIRYAADHGANVINMSLGGPLPSRVLSKAIEYAHDKGVTTICAAGNESRGRVGYPAANKHSVAISATNFDGELSFYSNFGKHIDVAAPGGDTRNDKNGDGHPDGVLQNTIRIQRPQESDYLWFMGTSMAAPHAAGVAALIVGEGVTNPDEVERIMKETAIHPKKVKWDKYYGAGVVDAYQAVSKVHEDYAPERAGLAGLLALLGLGGLGLVGLTRRRRFLAAGGLAVAAAAASGALGTTPIAYGMAEGVTALTGVAVYGSPLILSAALPVIATLLLLGVRPARPILAGLALGYAALLLHGALALPTLVSGLPGGPLIDRLWLGANAALSAWLAWRVSRVDTKR